MASAASSEPAMGFSSFPSARTRFACAEVVESAMARVFKHIRLVAMAAMCGLILSLACLGQETGFYPSKQRYVSAEDSRFLVSLVRSEPCEECPSVNRFVFQVKDKTEAATRTLILENETAQVDEIGLAPFGKLVVIGRFLPNTSIVTVVDLRTDKPLDSFFCFRPALSPDRRFVAYEKVYPAHFVENVSAQYLLYDFELPAEKNRKSKISLENLIDVGHPLFPFGSRNDPGDNLNVSPENRHTLASDTFYWAQDSDSFLFMDRAGGENSLVVVDLSAWPNAPLVHLVPLETEEIVDAQRCEDFQGRLEVSFHVVSVTWLDDDREVILHFRDMSPPCLRRQTYKVPLPR